MFPVGHLVRSGQMGPDGVPVPRQRGARDNANHTYRNNGIFSSEPAAQAEQVQADKPKPSG
jgi:hypothetical protein